MVRRSPRATGRIGAALLVLAVTPLGARPGYAQSADMIHVAEPDDEAQWAFDPPGLQVPVGETVTWANNGLDLHTVTGDDYAFDSGILDSGQYFQLRFDTPGTYHFRCTIHPVMEGTVVVGPAEPPRVFFRETGFAVDDPDFAAYFRARGGVRTFGYPLSRVFTLRGESVQVFQRFVLRRGADGAVRTLDLPGADYLPYADLDGATIPAADPALIAAAPSATRPDYAEQALAFVAANVPDTFRGQPVGLLATYRGTVSCPDAFPSGPCDAGLLPALALEVWGFPTSRPAADPRDARLVYQRFERGVLEHDSLADTTGGLLLGDLFKRLLTGQDLPADLASEAADSPFLRQYAPALPRALARPADLPDSDLTDAFTPQTP